MKHTTLSPLMLIASFMLLINTCTMAEPATIIEAKSNHAIKKFHSEVRGGKKFLSEAEGYLVFPEVVKGGFVIGGKYGEGLLRIKGKTKGYYSIAAASIGFQIGLQKSSYIIAFVSKSALRNFRRSNGWEAGVDGAITVAKWGVGKDIGTMNLNRPIYAFVFGAKGLMYNLTIEGTKFTKLRR